jgi:uncharacterized protein YeeX (DUF496 family)/sarcosine oxidase delta subunit
MFINDRPNGEFAIILKKNYEEWKRQGLSNNGYFIIFDSFMGSYKLKNISGNALKLYIYFGINSKNMTGEVWHSNKSIATYFEKSERTIRDWVKELEDMHLIRRMQLKFNGEAHTYIQPYILENIVLGNNNQSKNELNYTYKYRIKNAIFRESLDLKTFEKYICDGVHRVFLNANIKVTEKYFEIILSIKPTVQQLRKMGYEIKNSTDLFNQFVTRYEYTKSDGSLGVSTQLFERHK